MTLMPNDPFQWHFAFRFLGATGHPSQELPHPLQLLSVFLNDFSDLKALITKRIIVLKTIIHVIISCITEGIK